MNLVSQVGIRGFIKVVARDAATGRVLYREDKPNLIVAGSKYALARMLSQRSDGPTYDPAWERIWAIHIGDSNTPPTTSQTALLGTNTLKKAVNQPVTIVNPATTSGIVETQVTFGTGDFNGYNIQEVGLFTRGSDGGNLSNSDIRMLARQIHGKIEKSVSMTVTYTWRYQITV
jgi:hypothetical protein